METVDFLKTKTYSSVSIKIKDFFKKKKNEKV